MSGRYVVSSRAPFTSTWTKNHGLSLVAALEAAWRKHNRDWSVDSIARGQGVVIDRGELLQAFTQMDNLVRDEPKRPLHEVVGQVIQEMGKAEANEKR